MNRKESQDLYAGKLAATQIGISKGERLEFEIGLLRDSHNLLSEREAAELVGFTQANLPTE